MNRLYCTAAIVIFGVAMTGPALAQYTTQPNPYGTYQPGYTTQPNPYYGYITPGRPPGVDYGQPSASSNSQQGWRAYPPQQTMPQQGYGTYPQGYQPSYGSTTQPSYGAAPLPPGYTTPGRYPGVDVGQPSASSR